MNSYHLQLKYVTLDVTIISLNLDRRLIENFKDKWLAAFFLNDKPSKKVPAEIRDRLFRKLQMIDDATCDLDLRSPPSNHFEKNVGSLKGKYSIRVNNQWRLIFDWDEGHGEANMIYLDNHDYR